MKTTIRAVKFSSLFKTCVFSTLATMTFSVWAANPIYIGNPTRPDTIWVPGHCEHGCWAEGHYVKFLDSPTCPPGFSWIDGQYDRMGNWIGGHYSYNGPVKVVGGY